MTTNGHPAAAHEPGHRDSMAGGDHHDTDDHGADGEHDDHAHAEAQALGPIDVAAWGAGLLGVVLGLAMTACFYLATLPPAGG